MRVRVAIAFVVLQLAAFAASACSCAFATLGTETARAADTVFVFQLMSARFLNREEGEGMILEGAEGTIRVVESLRGDGSRFDRISYNTLHCCGSRLDVGHYYLAFVSGPGPSFGAGENSIVRVGEQYRASSPGDENALLFRVHDLLEGRSSFEEALPDTMFERVGLIPPPPPPPCPPVDAAPAR